jgi:hypothetical protein
MRSAMAIQPRLRTGLNIGWNIRPFHWQHTSG